MKNIIKPLAVLTALVAVAVSAVAGECCTKAAEKAKQGQTCAKCEKGACCKEAVKKLGDAAKPCEKCSPKK